MYDSIDIILHKKSIDWEVDLLSYVSQFLDDVSETYFSNTGRVSIIGYNGSMKFVVSENAVRIKDTSLCKWYSGDNLQTLTRGDVQRAFEKVSDIVHLPIDRGNVTRFDIATNFIVKYDVEAYYELLGSKQYFHRNTIGNGLYYSGSNGKLIFYDKLKDAKIKKMPIPSLFEGKNVLRYERRFEKRICKQFNRSEIKCSTLYNEKFYIEAINKWHSDYESISRIRDLTKIDYSMIKTKSDLQKLGILIYVESRGGLLNVLQEVKQAQKMKLLTDKQAFSLRNLYKDTCNDKLLTSENELIHELDKKVRRVKQSYH